MGQLELLEANGMRAPLQFAILAAALCVVAGLVAASRTYSGSDGIKSEMPIEDRRVAPRIEDAAPRSAMGNTNVASSDVAAAVDSMTRIAAASASTSDMITLAALPEPSQMPTISPPLQAPTTGDLESVLSDDQATNSIAILDECFVLEVCVDHYLWALYQRPAKVDTSRVHEWRKVTVKKKRKTVTVTRRFTKLVTQDFTWKDPNAAEKAGIPLMDYVIGGMDREFKLRLFQALRAAEKADLSPGITSGFRDDYRQSIASGLKAASNKSYHGGSLRGGYGHGVAVDVVSVKGVTKVERWAATESLWKWIDANETEFGIGRPYLRKDPAHLAPIDGEEYTTRRGTKPQLARSGIKTPNQLTVRNDHKATKAKSRMDVGARAVQTAKQGPRSGGSTVTALKRN
jgi:hypothetical protein